jgi:hypothetical protein
MPNQYIMTAHQLCKGDVVTEQVAAEHPERFVRIEGTEYGAVEYLPVRHAGVSAEKPVFSSVIYVTGVDLRTHTVVKWTVTGWRRFLTRRPELGESF